MKKITALLFLLCALSAQADVSFDRIVAAVDDQDNWLTHSGTYNSERYSPLSEINTDNVNALKVVWAY